MLKSRFGFNTKTPRFEGAKKKHGSLINSVGNRGNAPASTTQILKEPKTFLLFAS
jgi:hypothetical protein